MIIDKSLDAFTKELLTYYQNKDFFKAQHLANLMIKKFPKNNLSWQILSFIYLEQVKIHDAYNAITNASKIDPKDFKVLINLGLILFKLGLYDKSILTFERVLEINKDNFSAYINLGAVFQKKNDFENAELNYMKAIKINPNSSIVYNNLANTLKDLNRLEEVEQNYKKALKIDPNYKKAS